MAGYWNEIGYHPTGRRLPLNNRLFAGQFQTGRVNLFLSRGNSTNINIINSGYDYPPPPPEDHGMSGWMKAAMWTGIGGGFLRAIGDIITAWGGSHRDAEVEGKGGTEIESEAETRAKELAAYKEAYKDKCKIADTGNGYYLITPKGGNPISVKYEDLQAKLEELFPPNGKSTVENIEGSPKQQEVAAPAVAEDEVSVDKQNPFEDMVNLYKTNGVKNELVSIQDKNLSSILSKNGVLGVIDDSKRVADFNNATITSGPDANNIVTMSNGRHYKVLGDIYKDGCVYLQDIDCADGNKQIYILEKNGSHYELHQRDFIKDKTVGYDKPAKTAN